MCIRDSRIEERDLDFEVGASGVREIDDVLDAMDEMRASLKRSLEAQWRSCLLYTSGAPCSGRSRSWRSS